MQKINTKKITTITDVTNITNAITAINLIILALFLNFIGSIVASAFELASMRPVTIAIIVRNQEHYLPFFFKCIESQTWPKAKTYLYIKTFNNSDDTVDILDGWYTKLHIDNEYEKISFDYSSYSKKLSKDPTSYQNIDAIIKAKNEALRWAKERHSDCLLIDCNSYIMPNTLENLVKLNAKIAAPMLDTNSNSSNFKVPDEDINGHEYAHSNAILNRETKGLIKVPITNGVVFIKKELIGKIEYLPISSTIYQYVRGLHQALDNSQIFGIQAVAKNESELINNVIETLIKLVNSKSANEIDKGFVQNFLSTHLLSLTDSNKYILAQIKNKLNNPKSKVIITKNMLFDDIYIDDSELLDTDTNVHENLLNYDSGLDDQNGGNYYIGNIANNGESICEIKSAPIDIGLMLTEIDNIDVESDTALAKLDAALIKDPDFFKTINGTDY